MVIFQMLSFPESLSLPSQAQAEKEESMQK
jgi:hypothetical protein